MNQDTLHQINDLYIAIEQLKNELKPIPKNTWEIYGGLALSLIASGTTLIVAFSIYALTRRKDKHEFMGKLYGELISEQLEIIKLVGKQNHLSIHHESFSSLYRLSPTPENLKLMGNSYLDLEKTSFEFLNAHKAFRSKVGVYIYYKKGKTKVTSYMERLEASLSHKAKPFPQTLKNETEITDYGLQKIREYSVFWKEHVDKVSYHLVECVRQKI